MEREKCDYRKKKSEQILNIDFIAHSNGNTFTCLHRHQPIGTIHTSTTCLFILKCCRCINGFCVLCSMYACAKVLLILITIDWLYVNLSDLSIRQADCYRLTWKKQNEFENFLEPMMANLAHRKGAWRWENASGTIAVGLHYVHFKTL